MKIWSKSWKASKKPGKQRKYAANSPVHIKRRMMSAHLSKDLRAKHGTRSVPLRSGDKVKIMRGRFKGHTGSVDRSDIDRLAVYITGIEVIKKDGSKTMPPIRASNVMITDLSLNDKRRLSKKKKAESKIKINS
ncbi:MAG: 50S ribosomal protein L24 [Nanoarchaeota archaeon]|nr:50S ribosomal protein L24 [Nanoarchaeota archaeon]